MPDSSLLFSELQALATEQRNPRSTQIDTASVREILEIINIEDHHVPLVVREELPYIAQAVEILLTRSDAHALFPCLFSPGKNYYSRAYGRSLSC